MCHRAVSTSFIKGPALETGPSTLEWAYKFKYKYNNTDSSNSSLTTLVHSRLRLINPLIDIVDVSEGMDRSIPNRNRKRNETVKVPSLEDMCFRKVIDNVKHIGNVAGIPDQFLERILPHCNAEELKNIEERNKGTDLSHLTNYLWQNFYRKRFGQRSFKSVVEKISSKNVTFRWKDLYEAKLKNVEQAEQESIERIRQLYQNEDAQKKSRQVKPCTKVPPSSHKRNCYGGWGPGRIVGSSKSSLMKKSREDFVNSQEVRNLTALRQNAVQKNDRPLCIQEPGGFTSNGSSSNSQGSRALQRR